MQVRIVKEYNNKSPLNGVHEVDFVDFASAEDAALFVTRINANDKLDFEIVDYDFSGLITGGKGEIIMNPTGGYVGLLN